MAAVERFEGVVHQHRHGHRADAAGDRGDPAGTLAGLLELHIAHQLAVVQAIHADVDDHRSGLDPLAGNQVGLARRDDEDVRAGDVGAQIAGEPVADRRGGPHQQQLEGHRAADDVGGADDHRMLALERGADRLEEPDDPIGRAGPDEGDALDQAPDVVRVETVNVLGRVDLFDDGGGEDLIGQGQLHQDAVDLRIAVELVDEGKQGDFRGGMRQIVGHRADADLLAGLALVAHVDLGGGVVADLDDGKRRTPPTSGECRVDGGADLIFDLGGQFSPVDHLCSHGARGPVL